MPNTTHIKHAVISALMLILVGCAKHSTVIAGLSPKLGPVVVTHIIPHSATFVATFNDHDYSRVRCSVDKVYNAYGRWISTDGNNFPLNPQIIKLGNLTIEKNYFFDYAENNGVAYIVHPGENKFVIRAGEIATVKMGYPAINGTVANPVGPIICSAEILLTSEQRKRGDRKNTIVFVVDMAHSR